MIKYKFQKAKKEDVLMHLKQCDHEFIPNLSSRVNINDYAEKIYKKALTVEAWCNKKLVGLIAFYINSEERKAFITNVSVFKSFSRQGIADKLLRNTMSAVRANNILDIALEVNIKSRKALAFYIKNGFEFVDQKDQIIYMNINRKHMSTTRDYNNELKDTEDHKYAYNFDFDVMHPFMLKSFIPFFNSGSLLELGSFKGDFTRRFLPYFDDITCVEASDEAIRVAKSNLGGIVTFFNSTFETLKLPKKYDNIVLTHVLEHLDDPVYILKRINDEWLSDIGRLFLVCPNANAPSRQIAVKMNLITHNTAVTPAEKAHGHHITYTLDTLERDAKKAGLKVMYRSGIFFKALANFQWDLLMKTDIISKEYLEGCYDLGQQYPDLCSSIFLMCERSRL